MGGIGLHRMLPANALPLLLALSYCVAAPLGCTSTDCWGGGLHHWFLTVSNQGSHPVFIQALDRVWTPCSQNSPTFDSQLLPGCNKTFHYGTLSTDVRVSSMQSANATGAVTESLNRFFHGEAAWRYYIETLCVAEGGGGYKFWNCSRPEEQRRS
eukprot:TRINITY_DN10899_c0_g1_i2.p1 TRINITY_DN10899_c0_g1~~TRINITY_DN10899_c0_g1_i2.p1  ORF type:complete len:155 (+),score=24.78 TRINITY_DN10899_c0_g1_i2:236-700(+)